MDAYLDWTLTADIDQSDLVMLSDPRLRQHLTSQWAARTAAWVQIPDDLPPARRARLLAVRLIADGSWFADASGVLPLAAPDRAAVRALAHDLLSETS